ncbi:MAG: hypothetical protein KC493_13775 [Bacteriovoracaceae bacterium]|nr:hypothetical protein [Bacteriovoracaceae bacterium]
MKTTRIASAILGLTMVGTAFAAGSTGSTSTSTASTANLYQKLKESPASFSILSDYGLNKNKNNQVTSVDTLNIAYLGWKVTSKDKVRIENRWSTSSIWNKDKKEKSDTTFSRQVLKYTRSGLLSQDKHGINLSGNLEWRHLPDTAMKGSANSNGGIRTSLSASRSLKNGISLSGTYYHMRNLVKNRANKATYTYYDYLVTTQSYGFTDKISLSITEEFFKNHKPGTKADAATQNTEDLSVTAELGYQFNPIVYGGVYAGNSIMTAHDGRTFQKEIFPNANWGVNFYISAF